MEFQALFEAESYVIDEIKDLQCSSNDAFSETSQYFLRKLFMSNIRREELSSKSKTTTIITNSAAAKIRLLLPKADISAKMKSGKVVK